MILDGLLLLSDAQVVTASAASTNAIDLGISRDLGTGKALYILVVLTAAMTDAGSDSTVTVTLESDDNSSFSSATLQQTIGAFPALSAAGARLIGRFMPGILLERYIRLYYTVAGGSLSTGTFDAFLVESVDSTRSYATGSFVA